MRYAVIHTKDDPLRGYAGLPCTFYLFCGCIEYANFDGDIGPSEYPQKRSTRDGGGATCPEPPTIIAGLTPSAPGLCVYV